MLLLVVTVMMVLEVLAVRVVLILILLAWKLPVLWPACTLGAAEGLRERQ